MTTERSATTYGDVRQAAAAVAAAWRHEFAALARALFGSAFEHGPGDLRVEFLEAEIALRWVEGEASRELGHVERGQEHASRALRAILSDASGTAAQRRDMVLVLYPGDVLRPTVRLPHASQRILRDALRYELERLSPVAPGDVCFDFRILSRDRQTNTVEAELRIIRRDIVDDAVKLCHAAGLAIGAVRFGGDERLADWRAFPVDRKAVLRRYWRRWNVALLGGSALLLLLAVLLAAYLRGAADADALSDQVLNEGIRAARVERLQQRIDQTAAQMAFLDRQKRSPLFVAVLADIARTLPDGTWISEMDLTGNKIRLEGYSHAASDLIGLFDRSGRFANAQFVAPVTQGSSQGVERFDLTVEIAGAGR